ncbi:MAG: tetratricopeptide repeat protein, partial [Candidatus Heimdallarchaeota archaeon]
MFPFISDELLELENIVQQGNILDVQKSIKGFKKTQDISDQSRISIILLKVYISLLEGNTAFSQQYADEALLLAEKTGNAITIFDAIILKAEVWRQLGNFIGAEALRHPNTYSEILPENLPGYIELVNQSEKYLDRITDKTTHDYMLREAWFLRCKGIIHRTEKKLELSHRCLKKSLRLFEKCQNIVGIADVLQSIALAYGIRGNWGKEIKYLRKSLSQYKKLNFQRDISNIQIRMGTILFHYRSKFDAGFRYLTESLTILETIGCDHGIAVTLGYLGNMFTWQGDLIRAFKYLQRSLLISERIGNTENLAFVLNNLGWNYHIRGELYLALESLNRSMEISREKQYPWILIWTLSNIGLVHQAQTKFDSACGYYTQSILICEEIDDYLAMAWSLYQVIKLTIDTDSLNHMKAHISRLEGLSKKYQVKLMNQMSRVAKGMLLKRSSRLKDKVQAQDIFEQIATEKMEALEVTA